MPVPDQVRDDGSGIQNPMNLLDSGFCRNDVKSEELTFCEFIRNLILELRVKNIFIFCSVYRGKSGTCQLQASFYPEGLGIQC